MTRGRGLRLPDTVALDEFLETMPEIDLAERTVLCEQALRLLDGLYVHLRLKRAMHAIDPIQRLRLLQRRTGDLSALEFQAELLRIFGSLRDLHTRYQLGGDYRGRVATLGILVERYFDDAGKPHYLISHVHRSLRRAPFEQGVELLAWNGVPIGIAVERNAEREGGSNHAARIARGLEALTLRPLRTSLPPDERFVILEFAPVDGGRAREIRIEWRVLTAGPDRSGRHDAVGTFAVAHAIDVAGESARDIKRRLFAPGPGRAADPFAKVMKVDTVRTDEGAAAYLRLYSFNVADARGFVTEVVRRVAAEGQRHLIVDIRANPGGLIPAAEGLLAVLSPHRIEPARFSLANTPTTLALCDALPMLRDWTSSIDSALETGEAYSQAFPLSDPVALTRSLGHIRGKKVLITDARCYSAADIFAAGFQDNGIGLVLGVDPCTGAGGANVWSHDLLRLGLPDTLGPLPGGAGMRVALRRATRVGAKIGVPLEDLGVAPDHQRRLTRRDVTGANEDLIAAAIRVLASRD